MRHLTQPSSCSGRLGAQRLPTATTPVQFTTLSRNCPNHSAPHRALLSPIAPTRSCPGRSPQLPATTAPAATGDGSSTGTSFWSRRRPSGATGRRKSSSKSRKGVGISQPPKPPDVTFVPSKEQQHAIDLVLRGKNIFLTGCAGTGKSATLREIRHRLLYDKYDGNAREYGRRVAVVAMTGLAATIVGGTTIHSLLALRRSEHFSDFERMTYDPRTLETLSELDTLVLDEAGMMSAEMLQALDAYITLARKGAISKRRAEMTEEQWKALQKAVDRPFGGLQVILSGDVFQLAPIENKDTSSSPAGSTSSGEYGRGGSTYGGGGRYGGGYGYSYSGGYQSGAAGVDRRELKPSERAFLNRGFLFQAPVFEYGGFKLIELTEVFRQDDQEFVNPLNAIRCGMPAESRAAMDLLCAACQRPLDQSDGIQPTVLFSRNADVEESNERELDALPTEKISFGAHDSVRVTYEPPPSVYEPLTTDQSDVHMPRADFDAWVRDHLLGKEAVHSESIAKLPPQLAKRAQQLHSGWAKDVRKYLNDGARRSGGLFAECQARDPVSLKLGAQVMLVRNLDLDSQLVNGSRGVVVDFVEVGPTHSAMEQVVSVTRAMGLSVEDELTEWFSTNPQLPLVRFVGRKDPVVVPPVVFTTTVPGYGMCVRIQVPLKLAWAITVHKSQGMTLDKAEINVSQFWGHGMLYTALSRMRNMQGLKVNGYSERKMDPRVMEWWEALRSGRRYVNPHAEPGGPRGSPWCWKDPEQRVLVVGQSPQARRWLETNGAGWEEEEEEVVVMVRERVTVVVQEAQGEAREEEEQEEEGGQQERIGMDRAVEEQPTVGAGAGTQGQVQAQAQGSPVPLPPDFQQLQPSQHVSLHEEPLDGVLLQRRQLQQQPSVPPQQYTPPPPPPPPQQQQHQHTQQHTQQQVAYQPLLDSQTPQSGPAAPPASAPAARRLRHVAARAATGRASVEALLYGPKRAVTKAALEEELHRVVGLLREIEANGAVADDVGSG